MLSQFEQTTNNQSTADSTADPTLRLTHSEQDLLRSIEDKRKTATAALGELLRETSASDLVRLSGELYYESLLYRIGAESDHEASPGKRYEIGDVDLRDLWGTFRLMYHIVNVLETQKDVKHFEAMLNQITKQE